MSSDQPNTWAKAAVKNDWGSEISNVELHHRYDNDHKDDGSWDSIENGQTGETFDVGYWTGFLRTGYDYWLVKFEADGKSWTCKDNFYCFLTGDDQGGTIVCRVYKDGGEGKMEVKCPQSSSATVGLSSADAESKSAPGICDGTLVPAEVNSADPTPGTFPDLGNSADPPRSADNAAGAESNGAAQQTGSVDSKPAAAAGQSDAGGNPEQTPSDEFIEICLLDSDRKIINEANCKRVDGGDTETVYTTENADGKVKVPVEAM